MSTDAIHSKPKTLQKVINVFLIIANVIYTFGLFSVSQFPDFQFHERVIIAVSTLLLALFCVIKEFKVKPLLKRIYLNLLTCLAFVGVGFYIALVW
jgi:hypothetical protein